MLEKKTLREWRCKWKSCIGCPSITPGVALRIVVFVLLKSWDAMPRMEFRVPRISFWIPRAAPRIPRNSPRAARMALSLRERFSLKLGWSPGFWLIAITETDLWECQQEISHHSYRFSLWLPIHFHYRYRSWARNELVLQSFRLQRYSRHNVWGGLSLESEFNKSTNP